MEEFKATATHQECTINVTVKVYDTEKELNEVDSDDNNVYKAYCIRYDDWKEGDAVIYLSRETTIGAIAHECYHAVVNRIGFIDFLEELVATLMGNLTDDVLSKMPK